MKHYYVLLLLLLSFVGYAQSPPTDGPTHWTPQDIIAIEDIRNLTFSPDHQLMAWTKQRIVKKKDKFVSDLYLTRLDTEADGQYKTVQLTQADENDCAPLFSRDSETIYFLSSRADGKKLWSLSTYGGAPQEVHKFDTTITDINWLNDSTLLYLSGEGKSLYDRENEENNDNTVVVEDTVHWDIPRLYSFSLGTKAIQRLTDNRYPIANYAVSRDGRWVMLTLQMSPHYPVDGQPKSTHYLYNMQRGERTQLLQDLQTPGNFQFTPDSQGLYLTAERSSDPEWNGAGVTELYYLPLATQAPEKVALDWDWGLGGSYEVLSDGVLVHLANGATRTLAYYRKAGSAWTRSELPMPEEDAEHVQQFKVSDDGQKLAFAHSTAQRMPTYWVTDLGRTQEQRTMANRREFVKLNGKLKDKARTRAEVIRWKGYQNDEVTGILYYPHNYQEGQSYPLVLSIHGGPSAASLDRWDEDWASYPNMLAQRGAFVLLPNYHGSSNHGLKFVEAIKKNYYDPELEDITKGIDTLVAQGMVDRNQLGAMGWSNGAILTTMLTVRYPDMFKVAAPGAGDVNWTSDFGTCRFGVTFNQSYFGGAPWDDTGDRNYNEAYILKSPLFDMEKVKTPTILFHGSEDRAVPRDQGWEYYRALQQIAQAPVRFLWFPGEPHSLQKVSHQLRKMKEELAWLDTYLFNTYHPENPSLRDDSPLAVLLQREKSSSDARVGIKKNGLLLPEVVRLAPDSIALGKYEVTNAQYQAFRSSHTFAAGHANFPVRSISVDDAKAYVQWLSEQTKATYRLPNAQERRALHRQACQVAQQENTLDYWAGYALTYQDATNLRDTVSTLSTPLVREVGSHPAVELAQASIFDLGGNVAEYTSEGDTYGFSAYQSPAMAKEDTPVPPEYVGFRVVME